MEGFAVPLAAATVFTAGGYAITRAKESAEAVGDWLFTLFVATVLLGCAMLANQALERRRPMPQADRGGSAETWATVPLVHAWAQLDVPVP